MLGRIAIFENPNKNFLEYLDSLHNDILKNVPIEQAKIGFDKKARKNDKHRVTQLRWLNENTSALYLSLIHI